MIFVKGLAEPETPRLLPDGSWLVVEMTRPGKVTRISQSGKHIERIADVERPNGLAIGKNRVVWVAATHPQPSLIRVTLVGRVEVFSTGPKDEPFLLPNDICFGPDGKLYMTDSGIAHHEWEIGGQLRPDYLEAPIDGRVYQIDTGTGAVVRIDNGIKFTNGIAIGPDDNLYVNEMITGMVFRYRLYKGGSVGKREVVGNVMAPDWKATDFRGPDGMAYSRDGECYCAMFGQGDVTVLTADGAHARRIETAGRYPTNVSFGPSGEKAIYVTEKELGTIERFEVDTTGAAIYQG